MALAIEWFSDSKTARSEAESLIEADLDKSFKDLGSSWSSASESVGALIRLNGDPIGFFVLNIKQTAFELYKLFVEVDSRGQGHGAAAVDWLIALGKSEGFHEMEVEVADGASSFWESYLNNRELCRLTFPGKFQIHLDHDENDPEACPYSGLD